MGGGGGGGVRETGLGSLWFVWGFLEEGVGGWMSECEIGGGGGLDG